MDYYIERLSNELNTIFNFWKNKAIIDGRFATRVSVNGECSFSEPLGSLYVSRVLYGSSAAALHTGDPSYREIADLAYRTLRNQLSNPIGGYSWAVDQNGGVLHDEMHIAFVQAFVLYGLCEYFALTGDEDVKQELFLLVDLIENKVRDVNDVSYLDGFDQDWNPTKKQYKSFGTHLHLLEAYAKLIEVSGNTIYKRSVEQLIRLLIHRFINLDKPEVYHRFDTSWRLLPNENWIGHQLEAAWIVYRTSKIIDDETLREKSKEVLLRLSNNAIEVGFDRQYGGMLNRFIGDEPITTNKEWWPQAESVIAFLHAYQASHDKKYLSYAIRLLEYIDNTFSDGRSGEWYDSVSREGEPQVGTPKLHLWKSMYHNVRYCIEAIRQIEALFVSVS